MAEGHFYKVLNDFRAPLRDHLMYGYETRHDFEQALRQLVRRWHDRVGECIDERHEFLRLRFHDTPGGKPDEVWLPGFLLCPVHDNYTFPTSNNMGGDKESSIDSVFGFNND